MSQVVQKVPARSQLMAREIVAATGEDEYVPASVPDCFAVAVDILREVLVEVGEVDPEDVRHGHPVAGYYLDRLREYWGSDGPVVGEVARRRAVERELVHTRRALGATMKETERSQAMLREVLEVGRGALDLVKEYRDDRGVEGGA